MQPKGSWILKFGNLLHECPCTWLIALVGCAVVQCRMWSDLVVILAPPGKEIISLNQIVRYPRQKKFLFQSAVEPFNLSLCLGVIDPAMDGQNILIHQKALKLCVSPS